MNESKGLQDLKMLDYIFANNKQDRVKDGAIQKLFESCYHELKKIDRIMELIRKHEVYHAKTGEFIWYKPIDTNEIVEIIIDGWGSEIK